MGTGYLKIQVVSGNDMLPVAGAKVLIHRPNSDSVLYETVTDKNGNTDIFRLDAPDASHTLEPYYSRPAYSTVDVDVYADGFFTDHIHGVEIVDTQTAILPVEMEPMLILDAPDPDIDINIGPVGLLLPVEGRKIGPPSTRVKEEVIIPEYITVHLGTPTNTAARNVTVRFVDYVKNVTSSEIYSTWPRNSIIANVHVIVTFALNRVYTEWYRSRGFNFDITNSTSYDQYYRDGAMVFENISQIVDEIFNTYARRIGFANPFFTSFCNGTTATCAGLSQWGTVTLANQGLTPLEILRYYYTNDIELVQTNNITGIVETFPGYPLRVGSQGEHVRRIQNFLNRIRVNFPLIPQIPNPDGIFGTATENAVRTFQRTFNLEADGIVGRATWNKITFIYVGVTKLAELDAEGERVTIGLAPPDTVLQQGTRGGDVLELQFLLNYIALFYDTVPEVIKDSIFGAAVKNAVIEFQKTFGLVQDGIVGPSTWNMLYAVYRGIKANAPIPPAVFPPVTNAPPYPGTPLSVGSTGPNVRLMQTYLNTIGIVYPSIPEIVVDGSFGNETRNAVIAFQQEFLLEPDGIIGPITWNEIVRQFLLVTGNTSISLQYPGTPLRVGSRGNEVRLMQTFLSELRSRYPSLPPVTVDGVFGPQTESAVLFFQQLSGLTPDGIIGPATWYAIINARNTTV